MKGATLTNDMRILLLNDDALPTAHGGAAVIVDKLQRAYKAKGHEAILVTTHQDETQEKIERKENRISLLSNYPLKLRHRCCLGNPAMRAMLSNVFKELKPDAVHAHNVHTHITYESLQIAHKYTDKIILTAHDTFLASFGRVRGRRYEQLALQGKPMRMHWWEHLFAVGRKYWPLRNATIKKILKESGTGVVTISDAVAKFLNANGIPTIATIPNGIEPWEDPPQEEIQAFRKNHSITGPTVLFTGRVREDKGIAALLSTAALVLKEVPNTQFVINGEEENVLPFIAQAKDEVKHAVITTGWLDRDQAKLSYFATDIVTVPSLYLDNFPTVNLEAMAAGKPVVGTIFGGTPEVVRDGETGLIVNPRETEKFAQALVTLLKNPEKTKQMGARGRERVREEFSLERQCEKYLRLMAA